MMKSTMLNFIEEELDKVQQKQDKEISKYQQEIERLKSQKGEIEQFYVGKIKGLTKQQTAQNGIGQDKYEWLLNYTSKLDEKFPSQLMTKMNGNGGREAFLILLDLMEQYLEQDELDTVNCFIEVLQGNRELLFDANDQDGDKWGKFITKILLFNFYDIDERHDRLLIGVFSLLIQLRGAKLNEKIKIFLEDEYDELFEQVLYINMPGVIVQFMRLYHFYNLKGHVYKIIQHLIFTEWEFIECFVKESEFNSIFWYTYMLGLDQDFKSSLGDSSRILQNSNDCLAVYLYLEDCKTEMKIIDRATYEQKIELFKETSDLSFEEKKLILESLNDTFNELLNKKKMIQERFKWPTTEVLDENVVNNENGEFREKSALKELGYQITGMNRIERWQTLEKAVPKLGLKRVANIIAHHVRMRKGQKNGEIKFRYAIAEWEYDLNNLKVKYYIYDFQWPQY